MKYDDAKLGAGCGKGWEKIVDPIIERCKTEGADIIQIKEKFGELRIYVDNASEEIYDLIKEAEKQSYYICEECGESGQTKQLKSGWTKTLCEKHFEEREKQ